MRETILVYDVGTTNFKTILFDREGEAAFTLATPFRPAYGSEGMVFQDPLFWRNAVADGGARAAAHARDNGLSVAGISVTASRSSVIPLDRNGDHIGPAMMWQETATREIVNRLNRGESLERIYRRTGSRPNTVYSAPKMTWLRHHRPDTYAQAHKLAGIQDYIIRFLAGDFVTDHTFGSRTLLMDIRSRQWDDEMLALFEVDRDKLCRLIVPGGVAGALTPEAAAALNLPSGLPVVTAGGDQQNAAIGAGVLRRGDVMVNMGTGSFLVAAVDEPTDDPEMRVMCNASGLPGKWIVDASMLATGSVHRWLAENFYNEFPPSDPGARYSEAEREAGESPPGAAGLLALPHFSGCGAPHWNNRATGIFYGMTLAHGRRDLARAVFESIAAEITLNLDVFAELIGEAENLRLAGGLSQSAFFDQLLADVSGRRFRLSHSREATARGAWSQAAVALGWHGDHAAALSRADAGESREFRPAPELTRQYAGFLEKRRRLYATLSAFHCDG